MDLCKELEIMALNALEEPGENDQCPLSKGDIVRSQKVFSYSHAEAGGLIQDRRRDYLNPRVSEEHWETVQSEIEVQNYNQGLCKHSLGIGGKRLSNESPSNGKSVIAYSGIKRTSYIFKLEGPLDTPAKVQDVAGLNEPPSNVEGVGEDGDASFCYVNDAAKQAIRRWISAQQINLNPVFVRISQAEKDFSRDSAYPTLGLDTTLPQNRAVNTNASFYPAQNQYPVWYFFYGTLCDSTILSRQLSLSEDQPPVLKPATITGGILRTWAGKYQALVDSTPDACVEGSAYEVHSMDHENALRSYETDNYQVVRCTISMEGRQIQGCTFRFVGSLDIN